MLLCDERVERGDDEEGEDGADGHSAHQDEADRVAGGAADGLSRAVVRQHPS